MHNLDGEGGVVRVALGGVKMMGYVRWRYLGVVKYVVNVE